MLDERFSAHAFERLGADTPEADDLSQSLSEEIRAEMYDALRPLIQSVIARLKDLGHEMQDWGLDTYRHHTLSHSFGPSSPTPSEGWLSVGFDISVLTFFAVTKATSKDLLEDDSELEKQSTDEEDVPF